MKHIILFLISFIAGALFVYYLFISYENRNNYCEMTLDQAVNKYIYNIGDEIKKKYIMTDNGVVSFFKVTPELIKKLNKDFIILKDENPILPLVYRYNLLVIKNGKVLSQFNFFTCRLEPPML